MEKEFIPYELALRIKALGFAEPCICGYSTSTKKLDPTYSSFLITKDSFTVDAPLYQQAFRWFREKYNLQFFVEKYDENKWWIACGTVASRPVFKSYEEAELACLEKLIKIVESKSK